MLIKKRKKLSEESIKVDSSDIFTLAYGATLVGMAPLITSLVTFATFFFTEALILESKAW